MFGLITGALGLAGSAVQAISAAKKGREAKSAAAAAIASARGRQSVDKMSALQSPDISSLQQQETARGMMTSVQAIKDMGDAGQISNVYKAALGAGLEASQAQAQQDFMVDQTIAANKQELANQEYEKQLGLDMAEAEGAQKAKRDADKQMWDAIGSGVESVTTGALMGLQGGKLYGNEAGKYAKKQGYSKGEIDTIMKSGFDFESLGPDWYKQVFSPK
jgi:hypothetical protein